MRRLRDSSCHWHDIDDALRLRYKIFAEEISAEVRSIEGLERDEFDDWCDHLVVRDQSTLRVVGTYRMLPPTAPAGSAACIRNANSTSRDSLTFAT